MVRMYNSYATHTRRQYNYYKIVFKRIYSEFVKKKRNFRSKLGIVSEYVCMYRYQSINQFVHHITFNN